MSVRFTLDTNILFYAIDFRSAGKHEQAVQLVDQALRSDCILTLQSLGELFHAATRRNTASAEGVAETVRAYSRRFPVVAADPADLNDAIEAQQEHGLQFWDAMLWATARRAGCRLLLSEDLQDGRTLGGVRFANPFRLQAEELATLLG